MTRWDVSHQDILDADADGLICSANPHLNLIATNAELIAAIRSALS